MCLKKEKESALRLHAVIGFPKRSSKSRTSLLDNTNGMGILHLGLFLQLGFCLLRAFSFRIQSVLFYVSKILSGDEELGFIPMTQHHGES